MPEQAQVNILMELLALLGAFSLGLAVGLLVPGVRQFFARLWGSPRSLARGARQASSRLRESFRWPSAEEAAGMDGVRGTVAQSIASILTFRIRRAKTQFLEGQAAYQAGHLSDAYGKLIAALGWDGQRELLDDHVAAYRTLSAICEHWEDLEGAARNMEWVCELQPDDVDAHTRLGTLYSRLGDQGRAIFQLQAALGMAPTRLETRYRLYAVYRRNGMDQEAAEQLRLIKAGEDATTLAGFFAAHGQEHFEIRALDEAADDYSLALQLDPRVSLHYALLGDVYHVSEMPRKGLEAWLRGLWAAPAPMLEERVMAAAEDPALEPLITDAYREAMRRWPDRGVYPLGLARLALRRGDVEGAGEYLARVVEVDSALVEAYQLLASLHQEAERWPQVVVALWGGLKAARAEDVLYRCLDCGFISVQEQPRCFRCGRWRGFQPVTRGEVAAEFAAAEAAARPALRDRALQLWGRFIRQIAGPVEHPEGSP